MPSRLTVVLVSLLLATPAVIFWLWLVILPARVAKLCPERCRCDLGGNYVDCTSSLLNSIPLIFLTNVQELVLNGNNITSLEKDSFISRGLTELEYLYVDYCGLETIELGAFNGLTKLTRLSMKENKISEIIPRTFENMSRLEKLELTLNRLKHLEVDIFSGLINLKHIDLYGNKLQHLHPDMFVGLPNLEHLDLSNNFYLQIPTDHHFINSHSLSRLDISDCRIRKLSVETFANVSALEWLDLRSNNLWDVDVNILKVLPKLSTLYLHGNRLQCVCQLQLVWRWCQDHNIQIASGKTAPECETPSEVQKIWWGVLAKGKCLQDNMSFYEEYKHTSYNYTPIDDSYHWPSLKAFQVPIHVFLFIFGTTGNVILLIIIICNKDMRTVPNMYILNLAVSDMIYLVVHFSQVYGSRESAAWQYDDIFCKFFPFCQRLSVGLSAYSVAVLSIQRYRVTVDPFHVRVSSQQTWRVTVAAICGVWIVAALFALPSALSKRLCDLCRIYNSVTYYHHVVLFELLVSCLLPLCVIAFSYIMTARHLVKSAQPISEETQNPKLNKRKNTAKIVVGLTVVFLISYVPYHVLWTYIISNKNSYLYLGQIIATKGDKVHFTYLVSTCLLLLNSCLNPVALFCSSLAFRRQFKRYLTCCCKIKTPVTNFELRRRN
jgi:hypothetical protein